MPSRDRLTSGAMLTLVVLGTIWGVNMVTIKISNQGLAPVTSAGLRSGVASLLLMAWMRFRGIRLFHSRNIVLWGAWAGILFGAEFLLLYAGLDRTSASRGIVLLYTCPFWVAAGAHFYLPNDRLTWSKSIGLLLAFMGTASVMGQHALTFDSETLYGDLLALGAGLAWGVTTLVIKKHLGQGRGHLEPALSAFFLPSHPHSGFPHSGTSPHPGFHHGNGPGPGVPVHHRGPAQLPYLVRSYPQVPREPGGVLCLFRPGDGGFGWGRLPGGTLAADAAPRPCRDRGGYIPRQPVSQSP